MRKLLALTVTPLVAMAAAAALSTPAHAHTYAHADATGRLTALDSGVFHPPGEGDPVEEIVNPAAGCYRLSGDAPDSSVAFENNTDQDLTVYLSEDCTEQPRTTVTAGTTFRDFGSVSVKVS
ncbi:hypothetical protein [Streptomyces sp. NPDC051567]|uniref:hypothetical protein n=1 Tax=Streptomyces sp. NPDC051567 TaxID=3365660 RepID=UPI0037A382A0